MRVGIAFDLKEDFQVSAEDEDLVLEYDSPATVEAIKMEIERLGHEVVLLHGGRRFLQSILTSPVDLVFNIAEGRGGRGRESQVPAICEMLDIPFTHSDAVALGLSLDKRLALQLAASAGIPVPLQFVVKEPGEEEAVPILLPVVLKPLHEGSSMGIRNECLIRKEADLSPMVRKLLQRYKQPVLIEEFLPGKELTVGIVGNSPPEVIGVMEIAPRNGSTETFLYSMEAKRDYEKLVSYFCPPRDLPEETIRWAGEIALRMFDLLGCRDAARVDIRLDARGTPRFLEINPLPGLSPFCSDLCIMASLTGMSYGSLIERILQSAIIRIGSRIDNEDHRAKALRRGSYEASSASQSYRSL